MCVCVEENVSNNDVNWLSRRRSDEGYGQAGGVGGVGGVWFMELLQLVLVSWIFAMSLSPPNFITSYQFNHCLTYSLQEINSCVAFSYFIMLIESWMLCHKLIIG